MTKEDLYFLIETETSHEFRYNNTIYNMTFGSDVKGKYISFGILYEEKKYYSFGQLWNEAKIDNHFFREMLEDF